VSGWALSPDGVSEVRLLFSDGRVMVPAELFPWTSLGETFPWYPATTRPGFRKVLDRPKGVSLDTDLLVEIVDGAGHVTRLPHVFFRWHPGRRLKYTNWNPMALEALAAQLGLDADARTRIAAGSTDPIIEKIVGASASMNNEEFIRNAFRLLLGRLPDNEGLGFYLARISRGSSRDDVVMDIMDSKEFRERNLAK
jgi:hypothetical protein